MRGINLINIPSDNKVAARRISFYAVLFKAKYPMKNETALPAVNMEATVRNMRKRSASASWSLFKGKDMSTGFSRSRPVFFNVENSVVTGAIRNTTVNSTKEPFPRMSGIVSVATPKTRGNSMDIKKYVACRF